MKSKKVIWLVVVVVLILVAGAALLINKKDKDVAGSNATATSSQSDKTTKSSKSTSKESAGSTTTTAEIVTITYDGSSFALSGTTLKSGGKLTVLNQSSKALDFDSDPHPTHTDNSELNVGDVDPGQSKTVTLVKTGNWGFHNHFNSSQAGRITVE